MVLLRAATICAARRNESMQITRKNFVDTIPIRFEGHRILLDVRIGNKTATFLFDTGCSNTTLFDAQEPGIVPDGWGEALDSNGNLGKVSFCKIPEMQIGNTVIRRASAAIAPNDRLAAMESRVTKVKGGIGADLMAGGRAIKIDVKAKHIILTDKPKIFAGEKRHTTTFKEGVNCAFLDVEPFGGISTANTIFDTGVTKFHQEHEYKQQKKACHRFRNLLAGISYLQKK